jgi:hypothetical protein
MDDIKDKVLLEIMKIRAVTEILCVTDPHDIDRNTLAGLASIISETADKIIKIIDEAIQ